MQELEYLRNELNQRLNFSYEHMHKVLGHILLLWGGTLALLSAKQGNFMEDPLTLFLVATIFFISVAVLYCLSCRNYDNYHQILRIAAYIAIFYERRPGTKKEGNFYWEFATLEMAKKEKEKSGWKYNNELNTEYLILSIIAIAFKIILLSVFFSKYPTILGNMKVLMIGAYFIYIIISMYLSFRIFKNSPLNSKKWNDTKNGYLKSYAEYAIETEHYTKDEIKERFGKDFYNDVFNNG